ncbi:Rieske (2Fe-2S) protein [Granulicoccus phenolivorans]|uniref:Rieske (2Fe-2S) protein n=1 Tax=Granulicoccus phenolivorans TaxID=266854 RepID=UPI0003F7D63B|nr:Rieske (2Fe-2S) protein [Granulicoccus phenolivorans]
MATWFGVIRLEALIAEEPIPVEAGDIPIVLVRVNDTVHALHDRCPHDGVPLSEGFFEGGGLLECVLHQCRYALATGGAIRPSGVGVRAYPTRIVGGMVQVGITGGNPSDT